MCSKRKCACGEPDKALRAHFAAFVLAELDADPEWERQAAWLNRMFPVPLS